MKLDNRFIITILLLSFLFSFYVGRLVVMGSELKDQAEDYVDDFEKIYQEELETDDFDYGYYDEGLIDEIGYISEDKDNVLPDEVRTDFEETGTKATKGSRSIDPEDITPYDPNVSWHFKEDLYYMSGSYGSSIRGDGYVFNYGDFGSDTDYLLDIFVSENGYYRYNLANYILVNKSDISSWVNNGTNQFRLASVLSGQFGLLNSSMTNAQNGIGYNYPSDHLLAWSVPEPDPTPTPDPDDPTPTPTPDPDDPTPSPVVDQNFMIVCIFALGVIAGCISSKFILRFVE